MSIFRTRPKSKNITALVQSWFRRLEHEIAEAQLLADKAAMEAERQTLEKHKAKLAAALAKLRHDSD
jgi:hypothetical protein